LAKKMVPPELLNNTGVLMMEADRFTEAEKHLKEARSNTEKLLKAQDDDKRLVALRLNIKFNLACCYESQHKIDLATDIFKQIVHEEPSYTDAYLRLAYLARARGSINRSLNYIDTAKKEFKEGYNKPTNLYCMKGAFLQETG